MEIDQIFRTAARNFCAYPNHPPTSPQDPPIPLLSVLRQLRSIGHSRTSKQQNLTLRYLLNTYQDGMSSFNSHELDLARQSGKDFTLRPPVQGFVRPPVREVALYDQIQPAKRSLNFPDSSWEISDGNETARILLGEELGQADPKTIPLRCALPRSSIYSRLVGC
jgi:hypothetical protein